MRPLLFASDLGSKGGFVKHVRNPRRDGGCWFLMVPYQVLLVWVVP